MIDFQSPKRPWLAALMSLVLPGFGQLYNGQPNRAVWLFASFAFLCAPALALIALTLPDSLVVPALALGLLLTLSLWLYAVSDAWRVAHKTKALRVEPWQASGMYLAVLVLCGLLTLPIVISYVRAHLVQAFRIPSGSMQPTLLPGDFVTADMRYNCPGCKHAVKRGDVAIFVYPD